MTKFLILACFSVASLSAAPISLCSDLEAGEGNNLATANVFINPNAAWAANGDCGKWISYDNTGEGEGGFVVANAAVPGPPTAVFFEEFFLGSQGGKGSVTVWADDTARVRLVNSLYTGDGHILIEANALAPDQACAAGGNNTWIACESDEGVTLVLDQYLAAGVNTLYFDAYQRWDGPFGIMYSGSADSTLTPEPASYALLGSGLIALWLARRRKALRA